MEMPPNVILNPDEAPMITTTELEKEIPDFQWTGGHSGRILSPEDSRKLEMMWQEFLLKNHDAIDGRTFIAVGQFERVE